MPPPLLSLRGITKSFLGVEVLRDIDLDVHAGEVHAVVGENGAGKSTLMKILAGVHRADAGIITFDERQVDFAHPVQARRAGISTVFQEFNLLPERSVAENMYLGREPRRRGFVDRSGMERDTARLLADWHISGISPHDRVGNLSVARQQIVEIIKAVSGDARVISMDEPTAALADQEVELLYTLVNQLRDRDIAVLYVSHRLKEVFDLADTVTILKDGERVDTRPIAESSVDALVRTMVGREVSAVFPAKTDTATAPVRLEILGGGNTQLDGIDLRVHGGEILGLAGLQGSGRTEIAHALFGVAGFTRGTMAVDGKAVRPRNPRHAIRCGLGLVTEDRKTEGLALHQSIAANARLVLDAVRLPGTTPRRIPDILSSLDLTARSGAQQVRFLSGGNQQKVVLGKWLAAKPAVLVLDEPTRGIDVGAKQAVYALMRRLAAEGVAIVLITSELPEVIGMSDRICVVRDGRIAGELRAGELTGDTGEETVMALATGHTLSGGEP